ncbi:MAG: PAS domain-containing protein [Steroidobacteraceae bacterium]|jgi:PAS domain S-box-containing protein|nr:PAS domain-containing protein [Steroidobacteraceae bacterium]
MALARVGAPAALDLLSSLAVFQFEIDVVADRATRDPALVRHLGFDPGEVPDSERWWRERVAPEHRERLDSRARLAAAQGESSLVEDYPLLHRDGRRVWVRSLCRLEYDERGRLRRLTGCTLDIEPLRRASAHGAAHDARRELLLSLTGLLLEGGRDEAAIAQLVFERLSGPLGLDMSFNFRFDAASALLRRVATPGAPLQAEPVLRTLRLGEAFCGTVAASCHPLSVDAERIATDPLGQLVHSLGIRAYACHPLQSSDGRLLGTLSFASRRREQFDVAEVELLQTVCHFVALTWERLALEREVAERERFFREVADGLPLMLWVHDADGRLTFINRTYAESFGRSPADILGDGWQALTHPEDGSGYVEEFAACVRERRPFHAEVRVAMVGGRWRTVESWGQPRFGGDGAFLGFVGTTADVTERREAEAALRTAARQKDEFLAMLAHELRNPLASVRHASALLQRWIPPDSGARGTVELLERQSRQLARLVDDLLDVSRIAAGRITLLRERLELGGVLDQALETIAPAAQARGQQLRPARPWPPVRLDGDRVRLVQCLVNLLHNATSYTPPGGTIQLEAQAGPGAGIVEVVVRDDGAGIEPALLPHVFELFVQGERSLDRQQGGLGIGLFVTRRLVEMHGGTIAVASDGPGRGARFTLRLPCAAVADPALAPVHAVPQAAAAHDDDGRIQEARNGGARRVLVVDDNLDAATSLVELLRLDGHCAEWVCEADRVLPAIERFAPQVVLLDLGLPGTDGFELARRVRTGLAAPQPRLVALTGYSQARDRARAADAGFDDFLVKPADFADLSRVLQAAAPTLPPPPAPPPPVALASAVVSRSP